MNWARSAPAAAGGAEAPMAPSLPLMNLLFVPMPAGSVLSVQKALSDAKAAEPLVASPSTAASPSPAASPAQAQAAHVALPFAFLCPAAGTAAERALHEQMLK